MKQITGAIIGITLVLTAVFVPMAFFPGAVGIIYRQFSLTMVVSILFSGFLALSLTPALCATFLKPIAKGHHEKKGFFGWFNRSFDRITQRYRSVGWLDRQPCRPVHGHLSGAACRPWLGRSSSFRRPSFRMRTRAFCIVDMQGPPEVERQPHGGDSIEQIENIFKERAGVSRRCSPSPGFSFSGTGQNAGLAFVTLKDWSERDDSNSARRSPAAPTASCSQHQGCHHLSRCRHRRSRGSARPTASRSGCRISGGAGPGSAGRGARPAAGRGRRKARSLTGLRIEGHARRGTGQPGHRPRKGEHLWRHVRRHQYDDLGQSRFVLCQRLPECGTHAARHRAGARTNAACRRTTC